MIRVQTLQILNIFRGLVKSLSDEVAELKKREGEVMQTAASNLSTAQAMLARVSEIQVWKSGQRLFLLFLSKLCIFSVYSDVLIQRCRHSRFLELYKIF